MICSLPRGQLLICYGLLSKETQSWVGIWLRSKLGSDKIKNRDIYNVLVILWWRWIMTRSIWWRIALLWLKWSIWSPCVSGNIPMKKNKLLPLVVWRNWSRRSRDSFYWRITFLLKILMLSLQIKKFLCKFCILALRWSAPKFYSKTKSGMSFYSWSLNAQCCHDSIKEQSMLILVWNICINISRSWMRD